MRGILEMLVGCVRGILDISLRCARWIFGKTLSCFRGVFGKIRYLFEILGELRHFSEIFNDWVTRVAGIVLALLLGMLAFNILFVHFQEKYPFLQLISLVMVLILIIAGGIIFFIAIVKYND